MEESRRIFKFEGEPQEDFNLWMARTEAALQDKDAWDVVENDVVGNATQTGEFSDEEKKTVAKASAVIMQGLGDNPLRLCLQERENPHAMWNLLKERYAVVNVATKVQLQYQMARLCYNNQAMSAYIDQFQTIFNKLAAIGSPVDDDTKVATLLASFGDKSKSPYGQLVTALQATDTAVSWNATTARLLQEYYERSLTATHPQGRDTEPTMALNVRHRKKHFQGKGEHPKPWKKRGEKRRCYECKEIGHLARNCPKKGGSSTVGNDLIDGSAHHATMLLAKFNGMGEPQDKLHCKCSARHHIENCVTELETGNFTGSLIEETIEMESRSMVAATDMHDDRLLLDSGASGHMVRSLNWFVKTKNIEPKSIVLGNGETVVARKLGDIRVQVVLSDGQVEHIVKRWIEIKDVLYVPDLTTNLISCSQLCRTGYDIKFRGTRGRAMRDGLMEFQYRVEDGLYVINCANDTERPMKAYTTRGSTLALWHDRLGHAHLERIRELERRNAVIGLDLSQRKRDLDHCGDCRKGKQHRRTLKDKDINLQKGAVIHSDVSGRMPTRSLGGAEYYVTFIDEYSRYITVVPIASKGEVLTQFKKFHVWFERKYDCRIKSLHCDGGGEYVGCDGYLTEHGIERVHIPPYSPELNRLAERVNRTLMESARTMLFHAKMPAAFWAEAVAHAAEIRNRFICPRINYKTSYELLTGMRPRVDHLRVFGSLAWAFIPKDLRKKLDAKSEECVVIACHENSIYKVWVRERKRAIVARHVTILENTFPSPGWYPMPSGVIENQSEKSDVQRASMDRRSTPAGNELRSTPRIDGRPNDQDSDHNQTQEKGEEAREGWIGASSPSTHLNGRDLDTLTYIPDRPSRYREEGEDERTEDDRNIMSKRNVSEPANYPQRQRKQTEFYKPSGFLAEVTDDPSTVKEALSGEDANCWRDAIDSELQSLSQHTVWSVKKLPEGVRPLSSRFVFKKKMAQDGTIGRYKARLVVKGFLQGNVEHTFAPVVDFTTVRILLSVAVQKGMEINQMDVRTAFLHGEIDDTVFIMPPQGIDLNVPEGHALLLQKGLYGLKQAPRLWFEKWQRIMKEMEGIQMLSDGCLFRIRDVWVLLYVDDVILIGQTTREINNIKDELSKRLDMHDFGQLGSILGVQFERDTEGAWLMQTRYIDEILKTFGMEDCKSVSTPVTSSKSSDKDEAFVDQTYYQKIVGSLLFLASRTRPDISLAVNLLTRKASAPRSSDLVAAKRVLRYLKGTKHYGLRISGIVGKLHGYSDADWGNDTVDRRSVSGILLKIGSSPVFWRSKKQGCVSLSTSEAEFIAMSEATQHLIWLREMLKELGYKDDKATILYADNAGALVWGKEGVRNAKHVSIRKNFVKDNVKNGAVELRHCSTELMLADGFTKPLQRVRFEMLRMRTGVQKRQTHQEGDLEGQD